MLQLSGALTDLPIMSLRTGGQVGVAQKMILNPNNLKMEGWYCSDAFSKELLVLPAQEVREIIPQGIAINDHTSMTPPDELIRLKDILELQFELIGKHVITDHRRRVGKVNDFATDVNSFVVQKLYVSQPLYKTISGGQLSIDRTQIIEITDKYVKVRDVDVKVPNAVSVPANA